MKPRSPRHHAKVVLTIGALTVLTVAGYVVVRQLRQWLPWITTHKHFGLVLTHKVMENNELYPPADDVTQRSWELFLEIATPEFVQSRVVEYHMAYVPNAEYYAAAAATHVDNDQWQLVVNMAYADQEELFASTLVHEYAHIFSLDSTQVDLNASDCSTLRVDEGCAREGSAILAFYRSFWEKYGSDAPPVGNEDRDVAVDFYEAHEEDFLNDYGARNVVEDFAETFMVFVLEDAPTGDTVADDKLRFFWNQPDDVERRRRIREVLDLN